MFVKTPIFEKDYTSNQKQAKGRKLKSGPGRNLMVSDHFTFLV